MSLSRSLEETIHRFDRESGDLEVGAKRRLSRNWDAKDFARSFGSSLGDTQSLRPCFFSRADHTLAKGVVCTDEQLVISPVLSFPLLRRENFKFFEQPLPHA